MKIPARCNRRTCQARRNLSERPEEYQRWPLCHAPGCEGRMYVDTYRLRKLEVRQRAVCRCDGYPYPHRVDSPKCLRRDEFILNRSLRPVSKHSPKTEAEEF